MVVDQLLDAAGLLVRERPTGAHGAAGPVAGEGIQAVIGIGGPPPRDGLSGHAEQFGHLGLGVAQLTATEGTQPEGFEDLIGQLPCVGQWDGHDFSPSHQLHKWQPFYWSISEQLSCQGNNPS